MRNAAAGVAARAELVRIDHDALERLAATIDPSPVATFPEERWVGSAEDRAMGVIAWNAVNFGSGWFPHVEKLPGRSGARTLATRWRDHCARAGIPDAAWLASVDATEVAHVFRQPLDGEVRGLVDAFAGAWRELGAHLMGRHEGSAVTMVAAAEAGARGEVELRAVAVHAVELLARRFAVLAAAR